MLIKIEIKTELEILAIIKRIMYKLIIIMLLLI